MVHPTIDFKSGNHYDCKFIGSEDNISFMFDQRTDINTDKISLLIQEDERFLFFDENVELIGFYLLKDNILSVEYPPGLGYRFTKGYFVTEIQETKTGIIINISESKELNKKFELKINCSER